MLSEYETRLIEDRAKNTDIKEVILWFMDAVNSENVVAYAIGEKDARRLRQWLLRKGEPPKAAELRLRYGYHAAALVEAAYGTELASSWLLDSNRHLGNKAPTYVLRYFNNMKDLESVVEAAKAFISNAWS